MPRKSRKSVTAEPIKDEQESHGSRSISFPSVYSLSKSKRSFVIQNAGEQFEFPKGKEDQVNDVLSMLEATYNPGYAASLPFESSPDSASSSFLSGDAASRRQLATTSVVAGCDYSDRGVLPSSSRMIKHTIQSTVGDVDAMRRGYQATFYLLQQGALKQLLKLWIREIEPQKQSLYPYRNDSAPPWWPDPKESRFKEPDHLVRPECIWVATSVFEHVTANKDASMISRLRDRTFKSDLKLMNDTEAKQSRRQKYLIQLFSSAMQQQRFNSGVIDEEENVVFVFDHEPESIEAVSTSHKAKKSTVKLGMELEIDPDDDNLDEDQSAQTVNGPGGPNSVPDHILPATEKTEDEQRSAPKKKRRRLNDDKPKQGQKQSKDKKAKRRVEVSDFEQDHIPPKEKRKSSKIHNKKEDTVQDLVSHASPEIQAQSSQTRESSLEIKLEQDVESKPTSSADFLDRAPFEHHQPDMTLYSQARPATADQAWTAINSPPAISSMARHNHILGHHISPTYMQASYFPNTLTSYGHGHQWHQSAPPVDPYCSTPHSHSGIFNASTLAYNVGLRGPLIDEFQPVFPHASQSTNAQFMELIDLTSCVETDGEH